MNLYTVVLDSGVEETQAREVRSTLLPRPLLPLALVGRPVPQLLEILVCPVTHTMLKYDIETQELISERARLAFPIRDGIPIMLPYEAREIKS